MWSTAYLLALAFLCCHTVAFTSSPIIGILGLPESEGCITRRRDANYSAEESGRSCFSSFYNEWLYQAGARVVPLRYNMSDEEINFFSTRLNGILFTGGGLSLTLNSTYVKTAMKWLAIAIDPVSKSDPLALWGTCEGFQLLHIMVANDPRVLCGECYDAEDISWRECCSSIFV
jgi:gamma-glutamyl hydrolase